MVKAAEASIQKEVETVQKLAEAASKYPYYKYNGMWTRQVQDVVSIFLNILPAIPFLLLPLLYTSSKEQKKRRRTEEEKDHKKRQQVYLPYPTSTRPVKDHL